MGQMDDGSECLLCELWQDLDSADELHLCCRNVKTRLHGCSHDEGQVMNDERNKNTHTTANSCPTKTHPQTITGIHQGAIL